MKLSRVVMSSSTYDPACQSAELLRSRSEFAAPEYDIELSGGVILVTHVASGEIGVYSSGHLNYGCSQVPKPVEAPTAPEPPTPPKAPEPLKKGRK